MEWGEGVPTLDGGEVLPWNGVPTLNGGGVPTMDRGTGYLPWMREGYLPWTGRGSTYLGIGDSRQVMQRAVRLLRLPAGGLSCYLSFLCWFVVVRRPEQFRI